jgi:ankyrin repeat protein
VASEPIRLELWSAQCLIHTDKIMLATVENAVRLNDAPDFFDGRTVLVSEIFDAFQYSSKSITPSPVYIFKEQDSGGRIYIDIANASRDATTRDVFSYAVHRDNPLPPPIAGSGSGVINYSDVNINRKTMEGDTVLLEAIKNKSYNTIKSLLTIGANPFIRDAEGRSPLDLALANKDKALVEMLVEHMLRGASVEHSGWSFSKHSDLMREGRYFSGRNRLGETPLMRAAASGDEFAIISLVGLNAEEQDEKYLPYRSPYDFDYAGRQAFDIAVESGFSGAALLLERAMEKFSPSWVVYQMRIASELQDDTPVKCFAQPGKRLWLSAMLMDAPLKKAKVIWSARHNSRDAWRIIKTEEFWVSSTEYKLLSFIDQVDLGDGADWIIQAAIYLNDRPAQNGWIEESYSPASERDCDYDIHHKSSLQKQFAAWIPLGVARQRATGVSAESLRIHYDLLEDAVEYENIYAVQYLLEQGMSPQIRYGSRYSLLREAVLESKLALAQYLLTQGLDLAQNDIQFRKSHRSLVNEAVHAHDRVMVKFLVQQGLPLNEVDAWVPQPLVEALDTCDADMVAVLLDLGADLERVVKTRAALEGMTIRDYAKRCAYEPRVLEVINTFDASIANKTAHSSTGAP